MHGNRLYMLICLNMYTCVCRCMYFRLDDLFQNPLPSTRSMRSMSVARATLSSAALPAEFALENRRQGELGETLKDESFEAEERVLES